MSTLSMAPSATLPQLTLIDWQVFEVQLPLEAGLRSVDRQQFSIIYYQS